ncbi:MAG TPA: biotin/lipoyl-containing protein [Rhizomicrobium sp.]|nr:biotin/lipoyl-containing protein [Rhizomicrobium sp.]
MILTHDDVQEIIRILDASPYDELEIETDRYKLTLRRGGSGWTQATETARAERPAAIAAKTTQAETILEPGTLGVRAPLVGTFYRAPKPGAAPFVEVGDTVDEHTVVAIIETMKLMNSVHAGVRGVVSEICAANAEFVEHGRILMKLRAP